MRGLYNTMVGISTVTIDSSIDYTKQNKTFFLMIYFFIQRKYQWNSHDLLF